MLKDKSSYKITVQKQTKKLKTLLCPTIVTTTIPACPPKSSLFKSKQNSIPLQGYIILFIHLPPYRYLDCFHFRAIMNTVENINMQVFVQTNVFISLGQIPRIRITGWQGKFTYKILRNRQAVFQSDCAIMHLHQQHMRVPFSISWPTRVTVSLVIAICLQWV